MHQFIKTLSWSYLLRLSPAILGILGVALKSSIIFYIGGIFCLLLHIVFFFRETLRPIFLIILIYLISTVVIGGFAGFIWGSILSTLFEMSYHGVKTYISIAHINSGKK